MSVRSLATQTGERIGADSVSLTPREKLIVAAKAPASLASVYRYADEQRRRRMQHDVVVRIERAIAELREERTAAS